MTMTLETLDRAEATSTDISSDSLTQASAHLSIGLVVAVHFVAHGCGPQPEPRDFIEAVHLGLIELGDPWRVTERGQTALSEHGWLGRIGPAR
jgi:hypothetical protein